MEIFNGALSEEYSRQENKREKDERVALRQRMIDIGQKMVKFVKDNQIILEHSCVVGDYYFLARDDNRDFIPMMGFLVFGPKTLGYSSKPEIDGILNGMWHADAVCATKQMEEFMNNFNQNNLPPKMG